mmetsp:Transcript_18114/g.30564  ORF Transcript_18114/g.30564 Transcript_18114/m.30564 type:complete len:229 (+) Transcript_18114:1076-1762(+)
MLFARISSPSLLDPISPKEEYFETSFTSSFTRFVAALRPEAFGLRKLDPRAAAGVSESFRSLPPISLTATPPLTPRRAVSHSRSNFNPQKRSSASMSDSAIKIRDFPDTSCTDKRRRCSVASSRLSRTAVFGSWDNKVMSVNDIESLFDKLTLLPSIRWKSSSTECATLLTAVASSTMLDVDASLRCCFCLDTKPSRKEPTSGSINQSVRFSLRVMPLKVGLRFGIRY